MVYEAPSLPVYFKIKRVIKNKIYDGTYSSGTKIPGEYELAKMFGVNRQTVRRALILLVQEGYLKRFRKRGTFVSEKVPEFEELIFQGVFDDLFYHFGKFKTREVKIFNKKASRFIADLFELNPNKDNVRVIKRVRFLGEIPAAYTINYLPLEIGKLIKKDDLYKMPLLQIFKEKLNIPLGEAFQTIEASIAIDDIAKALRISPGVAVLLIQRTFFTKQGKPFDFDQTYYRFDKIRYYVRFRYDEEKDNLLLKK